MADLSKQPTNPNFLANNRFRLMLNRAPNLNFFMSDFQLPALSLGSFGMATPFKAVPMPGTKIEYDPLPLEFHVDEDLQTYLEIFNWLNDLGFPDDASGYARLKAGSGLKSDGTITILTSNQTPNINFVFTDMFPVSLQALNFSTESTNDQYLKCQVTFMYQRFYINPAS